MKHDAHETARLMKRKGTKVFVSASGLGWCQVTMAQARALVRQHGPDLTSESVGKSLYLKSRKR